MSTRLASRFAALKREGRAGLVAYVMASDPDHETCFEILRGLPGAGADVIEARFVVVAAGAMVRGDVPDHCIVGGEPDKVIRTID